MAATIESTHRRMVPRWRAFTDALACKELEPHVVAQSSTWDAGEMLAEKERDWLANRTLLFATDLIGAASQFGGSEVSRSAAEFVLEQGASASTLAQRIARKVLGLHEPTAPSEQGTTSQKRVVARQLKQRALQEPRNAFVWGDLSRIYTMLGLPAQAERAMRIALSLAPEDRFLLRSGARLFLHEGDPERARALLQATEAARSDPWLMAAEIALSTVLGKTSRLIKLGAATVANKKFSPFHTSELACAVASVELGAGDSKKAGRLFNQSLENPTENALAQTVWSRTLGVMGTLNQQLFSIPKAYEALCLEAYWGQRWTTSLDHAAKWAVDEPFSTRPFLHGSWVASSLLGDFPSAERLALEGLATNPKDTGLRNNLAFSLIEQGRLAEAEEQLKGIGGVDAAPSICVVATKGLLAFRQNHAAEGRALYQQAITLAGKQNQPALKATAMLFLAREEAATAAATAQTTLASAKREVERLPRPDLKFLLQQVENNLQNDAIKAAMAKKLSGS